MTALLPEFSLTRLDSIHHADALTLMWAAVRHCLKPRGVCDV